MNILRLISSTRALAVLASLAIPAAALCEDVTVMLPGDVPMTLTHIPAGTFMMGSPDGERGDVFGNEALHEVTLTKDYYLGKYEVTQAQWEAVMGTPMREDCGTPAVGDDIAVYCVTWDRVAGPGGFIEKLNELLETTEFRLPTEAEWEHAARAGTETRFAHGDVLACDDDCGSCDRHNDYMWYCGNQTARPGAANDRPEKGQSVRIARHAWQSLGTR